MKFTRTLYALPVVIAFVCSLPAAKAQTTITFEDLTGTGADHTYFKEYTPDLAEQGYTFHTHSAYNFASWNANASVYTGNYTGSIALFDNTDRGATSLTKEGMDATFANAISAFLGILVAKGLTI